MKKKTIIIVAVILLAVICAGVVFCIYNNRSEFTGNRIKNPDSYTLDFSMMNQNDKHEISINKGDTLNVEFEITSGTVNLLIKNISGQVIYRGDEIDLGAFNIIIPEDGTFSVEVDAENASGFVHIKNLNAD